MNTIYSNIFENYNSYNYMGGDVNYRHVQTFFADGVFLICYLCKSCQHTHTLPQLKSIIFYDELKIIGGARGSALDVGSKFDTCSLSMWLFLKTNLISKDQYREREEEIQALNEYLLIADSIYFT